MSDLSLEKKNIKISLEFRILHFFFCYKLIKADFIDCLSKKKKTAKIKINLF